MDLSRLSLRPMLRVSSVIIVPNGPFVRFKVIYHFNNSHHCVVA